MGILNRSIVSIALLSALAIACFAQSGSRRIGPRYIPNSTADAIAVTVVIDSVLLVNNTAGNLTVRIRDKSTNCNGGACPLVPDDLVVNAGSIYSIPMYGTQAVGGISWSASAANSIVGVIRGQ